MSIFFETHKNDKFIERSKHHDERGIYTLLSVDTTKVAFNSVPWAQLGDYGKRKFENLLVIETPNERLKFRYV